MYQYSQIPSVIKTLCKEYVYTCPRGVLSLVYGDLLEDISTILSLCVGQSFYFSVRPCGFEGSHFISALKFRLSLCGVHGPIYEVVCLAPNEFHISQY